VASCKGEEPALPEGLSPRVQTLLGRREERERRLAGNEPSQPEKEEYLGSEPFHEAWLEHAQEPFWVRLAYAQAAWRAAVQPRLIPGQLIQATPPPRTVISYPTGVFAWDFYVDEALAAEHPETAEVARYWRVWKTQRPAPELPAGTDAPGLDDALWMAGICCHSTQDYAPVLAGGLNELRRQLAEARPRRPEAAEWYAAAEIALEGVAGYLGRFAEACAAEVGEEWATLAGDYAALASGEAPACFRQACQLFYALFLLNGSDSPGRMDQYLWPALERDLAAGLSWEDAQEISDCLYVMLAEHVCYGATLGGQSPEGGDATNALTWLCLNSIRRLRLLSPRTALRWHRETPAALLAGAVDSLASGATFPSLVNDEAMIPGLLRRGVQPEHARDYTFCGCGQTIPSGRAYGSYEDLILNAAKPLTYALHGGREERSGEQIGPACPPPEALTGYEALEAAVWAQAEHLLRLGIAATAAWRRWGAQHVPDYLRSLSTHSCVERGLDWRAGGADYHEGMVDVVGLTTLADSLTAIRRVVYEEKRVTLPELTAVLDRDWEGAEDLWRYCLHRAPKFGNEDPEADETVVRWLNRLNDWLFAQRTYFGGPWGLDIVGWSGAMIFGERTGATPDGRRAGEALADCAGPAQGRDRQGITAALNSMLKLSHERTHGPLALSLRLPEDLGHSPEGRERMVALVRGYLERGGQHLQISMASAEEMRAAQAEPHKHWNLLVRVGGFSARFVTLEARFQEDMIRRTEHGV